MITAPEYLHQLRRDLTRRDEMNDQIAQLRSKAYPGAMRIKHAVVQESAPTDKTSAVISSAETMLLRCQQELAAIRRRRVQAQFWIDQIEKVLYRQILEQYYLTPTTVTEEVGANKVKMTGTAPQDLSSVASALGRRHGYIRRIHREAVEAFSAVSGLPMKRPEDN